MRAERSKRFLAWAIGAGVGMPVAAGIWALAGERYALERRHIKAMIPGLPSAWEGQRLCVLGDVHLGMPLANVATLRRALRWALLERPAAILLTGDFVYDLENRPELPDVVARELGALVRSSTPTYAVLGNHDHGERGTSYERRQQLGATMRATLARSGLRLLENEVVRMALPAQPAGDPLYLAGIDSRVIANARPAATLEKVPEGAPRIVLVHEPRSFIQIPPGAAPFAIAGHTHGGQIRAPFLPRMTLARLFVPWPDYADGWLDGYGQPGNRLYVNRGIGFSSMPVRFGCRPELTIVHLNAAGG